MPSVVQDWNSLFYQIICDQNIEVLTTAQPLLRQWLYLVIQKKDLPKKITSN